MSKGNPLSWLKIPGVVRIQVLKSAPGIDEQLLWALHGRLVEEEALEVWHEDNSVFFRNPWFWEPGRWTLFSLVDAGALTVVPDDGGLAVHYQLSITRLFRLDLMMLVLMLVSAIVLGRYGGAIFLAAAFCHTTIVAINSSRFQRLIINTLRQVM